MPTRRDTAAAVHESALAELGRRGIERLASQDPELYRLLELEHDRQANVLVLVAASSIADPSVLVCEGMATTNVTTEGYPRARFHAGCQYVDEIEQLAIDRAKAAFGARYANVQPHSGSSANAIVIFSLLDAGDTILGMDLASGGHLTHGAKMSVTGRYFNSVGYGVDDAGLLDYDQVLDLATRFEPRLIICGASSYPRSIDFARFREIADRVGAYLLADISHIAGLVVTGQHPSPIDHAHFTTTSTYKQLYGPRGGLILIGKDADAPGPDGKSDLASLMQRAVFPYFQGTPNLSAVAAKARALAMVSAPKFRSLATRVVRNAEALSARLIEAGYIVLTGGTDNHMVLVDLGPRGLTGLVAERTLESCSIIVNKNLLPGDSMPATITSGIRLGTNGASLRRMGVGEMATCAELIDRVLTSTRAVSDRQFHLDDRVRRAIRAEVDELCRAHPIPDFPIGVAERSLG